MSSRSVLAISWYPADAGTSGERVRFRSLMEQLRQSWDVSVLSYSGLEGSPSNLWKDLRAEGGAAVPYKYQRRQRAKAMVSGRSVHEIVLAGRQQRKLVSQAIDAIRPDVVFCNQLPPFTVIPTEYRKITVVDTHNAEYLRVKRIAGEAPWAFRPPLWQLARAAKRLEAAIVNSAAMTWAVSESDADYFKSLGRGRVEVVPNGTTLGALDFQRTPPGDHLQLLFVGSLSYSANRDALAEFATRWAPRITVPWTLSVVGGGSLDQATKSKLSAFSGVSIKGFVDDVTEQYRSHDALVAPIRQGGGTRLKVLEACSNALPVIATDVAVEGIGLPPGQAYFLANTPEAADAACNEVFLRPDRAAAIARVARRHVENFAWPSIGKLASALLEASMA